jgi:hypothetical protein
MTLGSLTFYSPERIEPLRPPATPRTVRRRPAGAGADAGARWAQVGGVRQLVVPPELGYPADDASHEKVRLPLGHGQEMAPTLFV